MSKHFLRMSNGVEVTATLNDQTGFYTCEWEPGPPFPEEYRKVFEAEYVPWRNNFMKEWSKKTGKKVMVIDL